jgi:hypothetical protein
MDNALNYTRSGNACPINQIISKDFFCYRLNINLMLHSKTVGAQGEQK